jgi:hypothetical protein
MAEKWFYINTKRIIFLTSAVGRRLDFLKRPPVKVKCANVGSNIER